MKNNKSNVNLILSIIQLFCWIIMGISIFIFKSPITTFTFVIVWLCLMLNTIQNIIYEYFNSKGQE